MSILKCSRSGALLTEQPSCVCNSMDARGPASGRYVTQLEMFVEPQLLHLKWIWLVGNWLGGNIQKGPYIRDKQNFGSTICLVHLL